MCWMSRWTTQLSIMCHTTGWAGKAVALLSRAPMRREDGGGEAARQRVVVLELRARFRRLLRYDSTDRFATCGATPGQQRAPVASSSE